MTVREAIMTLNANVVIACERSGFSSATVKMIEDALDTIEDALKAQEPRVTCSVCKYSRCLSGEWFCFMIGTSRYGKRVTDGDWYCKDAIGR